MIRCSCKNDERIRGRQYVYSAKVILGCFVVRTSLRFDIFKASYEYLATNLDRSYNEEIIITCGISTVPSTRSHNTGREYIISRY